MWPVGYWMAFLKIARLFRIAKLDSLPSAILVAAQLLFDGSPEDQAEMLQPIFTALLPWSMLHHQAIRCCATLLWIGFCTML